MEGFSSIDRVVGNISPEEKQKIIDEKERLFAEQPYEELLRCEREKTPQEIEIISMANAAVNEILEKYGIEPFEVPEKNIHVVPKDTWKEKGEKRKGFYNPLKQAVVLVEQDSLLVFATIVVHELIHFKSYNALQIPISRDEDVLYRNGMLVKRRTGKADYFRSLNEAVTETMAKRIMLDMIEHPIFAKEVEVTERIIKNNPRRLSNAGIDLYDKDTLYATEKPSVEAWGKFIAPLMALRGTSYMKVDTVKFKYKEERDLLAALIEKIFENNQDTFKDREEVYDMFFKSAMTGNLLEIGKIIDKTFGAGTFRNIGEANEKNILEKIQYIKDLKLQEK